MPTIDDLGVRLSPDDLCLARWRWNLDKQGYACRTQHGPWMNGNRKTSNIYLHKEVVKRMGGLVDGMYVDHINRNRLDNRRENLRMVTPQHNAQNRLRGHIGIMGIQWEGRVNRYKYVFVLDGKRYQGSHKRLKICKQRMEQRRRAVGYVVYPEPALDKGAEDE